MPYYPVRRAPRRFLVVRALVKGTARACVRLRLGAELWGSAQRRTVGRVGRRTLRCWLVCTGSSGLHAVVLALRTVAARGAQTLRNRAMAAGGVFARRLDPQARVRTLWHERGGQRVREQGSLATAWARLLHCRWAWSQPYPVSRLLGVLTRHLGQAYDGRMDAVSPTLCAARRSSCAAAARRCSRHNPNTPLPVAPLAALLLLLLVAGNLSTVRSTFLCCTPDQISNNTPGCGSLVASAANNATDCNAINDVVTAFGVSLTFGASLLDARSARRTGSTPS